MTRVSNIRRHFSWPQSSENVAINHSSLDFRLSTPGRSSRCRSPPPRRFASSRWKRPSPPSAPTTRTCSASPGTWGTSWKRAGKLSSGGQLFWTRIENPGVFHNELTKNVLCHSTACRSNISEERRSGMVGEKSEKGGWLDARIHPAAEAEIIKNICLCSTQEASIFNQKCGKTIKTAQLYFPPKLWN